MIRFEGVHKWFDKLHVLNNINLHVRVGEVVVVCGPSGSGKSTLLRTINDLEPISEGRLFVDGMDLSDKKTDINMLRAEIGFVFQQFNLSPHLSVLKNITLVFIVGVTELTQVATQVNNRTMLYPTEIFLFIAVIYFIMCFAFTELSRWLERRLDYRNAI